MPHLFSIGIQGALEEVAAALLLGERLCAFLDDVYHLCDTLRVKVLYELLEEALSRVAGIQLHQEKNKSLESSQDLHPRQAIEELGEDVRQPAGITVLGTPIGSEQYISEKMEERITKVRAFVGSHPHGARSAMRLADLAPERKSQSQPHNATRVLCLVLSDPR